jgi:hypothetical protein
LRIPTAVLSIFWKAAAALSSKQLLNCSHDDEWTLFKTHYLSEKLVALEIEPGPQDL